MESEWNKILRKTGEFITIKTPLGWLLTKEDIKLNTNQIGLRGLKNIVEDESICKREHM